MSDTARFAVRAIPAGALLCACQFDRPAERQSPAAVTSPSFVEFESGQVRPIALSPDGAHGFAVNTPNASLEIFDAPGAALRFAARAPVGREPVAVAARDSGE